MPWKRSSATAGNSERGIASTIATMSTRKDMTSTGRVAMNASPSITERSPSLDRVPSGGIGGSRSAEYSAAVNSTASTP